VATQPSSLTQNTPEARPSAAGKPAPARRVEASLRIAHLSDLHWGRGFNGPLWSNLCRIVREHDPQLIIVTGDLVNSPFRWTLKRALNALEMLARESAETQADAPINNLLLVTGNHDVRVLGICPVRWLKWLVPLVGLLICAVLYVVLRFFTNLGWGWAVYPVAAAVIAVLIARLVCFGDFTKTFERYLLIRPTHWTNLGLAIYPFDSSSRGRKYARGEIGPAEFVKAQERPELRTLSGSKLPESPPEPRYRIALLHHHPLPIPYDTSQEPLMIMEDAGAFLSEISNQRIPLVLHGHKHHHHFSRVTINAGMNEQFEASVLAAGTATAGKRPGRFGFNFNLVTIEADGNARVLVILSLPLSHPDEPGAVYAVLSIGSKRRASKLMELTEEKLAIKFEEFRSAVAGACFDAIQQRMLESRSEPG
jgi:predicted phosphodiesterase